MVHILAAGVPSFLPAYPLSPPRSSPPSHLRSAAQQGRCPLPLKPPMQPPSTLSTDTCPACGPRYGYLPPLHLPSPWFDVHGTRVLIPVLLSVLRWPSLGAPQRCLSGNQWSHRTAQRRVGSARALLGALPPSLLLDSALLGTRIGGAPLGTSVIIWEHS